MTRNPWLICLLCIAALPFLLYGLAVVIALAVHCPALLLAILAAAAILATRRRIRRRHQQLSARADYQHQLCLNGDPRGTYGQYPPAL